jgi:hypothetical protein
MAVNLNLLPPELAVSKSLGKFLKTVRALGVIGIAAFLVFGVGIGVFFIVSTISLNGINANIKVLKNQVSAQQKSEQQIILLKDRIAKIAYLQSLPSSLQSLAVIQPFLSGLSANIKIVQMSVDSKGTTMSVNILSSADLSQFLDLFKSSDAFSNVSLISFSFNQSTGYSIEIRGVNK